MSTTITSFTSRSYVFRVEGQNIVFREILDGLFYLWNDVFKNTEPEKAFSFKWPGGEEAKLATYQDFFNEADGTRNDDMLKAFLKGLGVKTVTEDETSDPNGGLGQTSKNILKRPRQEATAANRRIF